MGEKNLYGIYNPEKTTLAAVISSLCDNYHSGYGSQGSHHRVSIFSNELKRYLSVSDEKKIMHSFGFSKWTKFNLSISNDYAYGNYNHPSDDGDDDALAVRLAVDSMQIFCKMLTGKTMSIHVPSTATIFEVKRMIRRTEHIAVAEQTLIFAGRLLENDRTIGHYNIQKESTIHLIMDLRGGMYHETSGRNGAYGPLKSCVFNIKVDM